MSGIKKVGGVQGSNSIEETNGVSGKLMQRSRSQTVLSTPDNTHKENLAASLSDTRLSEHQGKVENGQMNKSKVTPELLRTISMPQLPSIPVKSSNTDTVSIPKLPVKSNTNSDSVSMPKPKLPGLAVKKATGSVDETSFVKQGTLDKLNKLDKGLAKAPLKVLKKEHENLSTQTHDDGKQIATSKELSDIIKPPTQELSDIVKGKFTATVTELDKAVLKGKIYEKAETQGRQMIASIPPRSDFIVNLSLKTDDELKEEVTKSMGMIKGKHAGKEYDALPANKQKLVDSIVKGIKAGLPQDLNEIQNSKINDVKKKIEAAPPESEFTFNLGLKTDLELKKDVAKSLGMGNNYDALSPNQKNFVDTMSKGIQDSLPQNTASPQLKNIPKKNGGSVDVPESVSIGGKTYNSPKYLGEGGLGRVLKYTNANDPSDTVVIKELLDPENRKEMVSELQAHKRAMGDGHPNVVDLKGYAHGPNESLYMVMSEAKGGDVRGTINNLKGLQTGGTISRETEVLLNRYIMRDVMTGMKHVQADRNMTHYDMKPENVLIDDKGNSMIADFGSARKDHVGFSDRNVLTTPIYQSPEMASRFEAKADRKQINQKSDTWTLGVMLNEMSSGSFHSTEAIRAGERESEKDASSLKFASDSSNRVFKNTNPNKNLDSMQNITNAMMHPDPSQRPTLDTVLNHSYFQDPKLNEPKLQELLQETLKPVDQRDMIKIKTLSEELDKIQH